MNKISYWVRGDNCAYRYILGTAQSNPENRVAFIEKTPRVRIRAAYLGTRRGTFEDGGEYVERQWEDFLNWCEGYKGDGPDDKESRAWCDGMLRALGYKVTDL